MTRAAFFAALLSPLLLPFRAAQPKPRRFQVLKVSDIATKAWEGVELGPRTYSEPAYQQYRKNVKSILDFHWEGNRTTMKTWDYISQNRGDEPVLLVPEGQPLWPRKAEEDMEILSSWVDQNSGNILALVILKKFSPKDETPANLLA